MPILVVNIICKITGAAALLITASGWCVFLQLLHSDFIVGYYELTAVAFINIVSSLILGVCVGVYSLIKTAVKHKLVTMDQVLP
jgi:hypothetical protein